MSIPTEPIGSIPRPLALIEAVARSALSLMYPPTDIPGYPREQFIDDLLGEHEIEVRRCLDKGAHKAGFSPFCDDTSTSRETAFAKIRMRVLGTALASATIGAR